MIDVRENGDELIGSGGVAGFLRVFQFPLPILIPPITTHSLSSYHPTYEVSIPTESLCTN
jgi:hypothetical protein